MNKYRSVSVQADGDLHEAVKDIEECVKGGFLALLYGRIQYLPCYATAGLRINLGLFNHLGKVCVAS